MTTRTAAEALEEVLALEQKATPGTYRYSPWHVEEGEAAVRTSKGNLDWAITFASDNDAEFIATVVNFIRTHAATLRAALAQPQEGEVEECADRLEAMAEGYSAEAAKFFRNAARLLRATQNTIMTPTAVAGSPSALSERPASSELLEATATPAQSAPAQEPIGWITPEGMGCLLAHMNIPPEVVYCERNERMNATAPLYAAPQPDEARELLVEVVRRYDDYRGKGVMPAPGEYQMVVGAIERIRAYLEKHK